MAKTSPFEAIHVRLGANFAEFDDWKLPSNYGNLQAENEALCQSAAAFDLSSFGRISIKGSDSEELIDKILGPNGQKPEKGKWIWISATDNQQLLDPLRLCAVHNGYLLLTVPFKRLNVLKFVQQSCLECSLNDVKITDITEQTGMLGLYGPRAIEAINRILPLNIAKLDENGTMTISVFMMSVTIIRGSWLQKKGVELICPKSAALLAAGAIAKYHKRENITPSGMECLLAEMAKTAD